MLGAIKRTIRTAISTEETYLSMQKRTYQPVTLEEARIQVNPHFEQFSALAVRSMAMVLREFDSRTQAIPDTDETIEDACSSMNHSFRPLTLLDFGCGVGRIMQRWAAAGHRVDGCDISQEMLGFAAADPALGDSQFFRSTGRDCGPCPPGHYDIIYSEACLQHICVRSIRRSIFHAMAAALKPHGMVSLQCHYYPDHTAKTIPYPHAAWSADNTGATTTNSGADVWVTPDHLGLVAQDFSDMFTDVQLQLCTGTPDYHGAKTEMLIITGSKSPALFKKKTLIV